MLVVIGGLTLAQIFLSDKLALAAMGAKEVSPEEAPGLHAMVEDIREILRQEQDHQIALATALGKDVQDVAEQQQQA